MTWTKSKRGCGLPRSGSGLTGRPVAGRGSCRARAGAAAARKRPAAALDSSNKRSNGAARTARAERRWIVFFARTRGAQPPRAGTGGRGRSRLSPVGWRRRQRAGAGGGSNGTCDAPQAALTFPPSPPSPLTDGLVSQPASQNVRWRRSSCGWRRRTAVRAKPRAVPVAYSKGRPPAPARPLCDRHRGEVVAVARRSPPSPSPCYSPPAAAPPLCRGPCTRGCTYPAADSGPRVPSQRGWGREVGGSRPRVARQWRRV